MGKSISIKEIIILFCIIVVGLSVLTAMLKIDCTPKERIIYKTTTVIDSSWRDSTIQIRALADSLRRELHANGDTSFIFMLDTLAVFDRVDSVLHGIQDSLNLHIEARWPEADFVVKARLKVLQATIHTETVKEVIKHSWRWDNVGEGIIVGCLGLGAFEIAIMYLLNN